MKKVTLKEALKYPFNRAKGIQWIFSNNKKSKQLLKEALI
jgi:hypothetical protein